MIPSPRRTVSSPVTNTWADFDDDDGWQDMPVVRSDDNPLGLDEDDQKRYHYRAPTRLDPSSSTSAADPGPGAGPSSSLITSTSNATGQHLEVEADTPYSVSWRQKATQDESDYTRIRLDEDVESDAVHMRTKYLFNEDKAMTPLSQMQATKELLTEGQRIAYVGLCELIGKRMLRDAGRGWEGVKAKGVARLKGKGKEEVPVIESANIWMIKIMARLYQHMEVERDEQRMIESLAEHGVDPSDLVPALMTTHTVKNPEFDPKAKEAKEEAAAHEEHTEFSEDDPPPPPYEAGPGADASGGLRRDRSRSPSRGDATPKNASTGLPLPIRSRSTSINPFGDDDEGNEEDLISNGLRETTLSSASTNGQSSLPSRNLSVDVPPRQRARSHSINPFGSDDEDDIPLPLPLRKSSSASSSSSSISVSGTTSTARLPSFDVEDEGDIGVSLATSPPILSPATEEPPTPTMATYHQAKLDPSPDPEMTPKITSGTLSQDDSIDPPAKGGQELTEEEDEKEVEPALPSLPGVTTSLTAADETVTLDIRWTVLCDLFLVLIGDSVYDSRSRAFLERVALALGFDWLDVVRFENRVTDALEIEEAVEKTEQGEIIEGRKKGARKKRYAMMGLAAVGGGLVIGLSAGLLAPVIGAGLGAAFATVGITGTTGFLAGAGGAAMITTGGVLTGANIAGKGMARRTREVRTFEFRPMHNNKRVSCYITMSGFMASVNDDVRLPFSTLDPIIGDVLSVLWEPDMMAEMGSALKILTSEVLTQVGQTVLQATAMTALLTALQWPIILTKLGYLIDNPWSNALDRARAAGLVLADTIISRHAGVRPISLIGFSLGARAIFYALVELARQKAFGLVQDVFLFGTTVTASKATWLDVRSVIAGRFVNGFATNDWMLGYLFRATSGGLNTVAGLRPVESVPGLENIEVTEIITGHMSYRSLMPLLLQKVGFPVTSDHFDEPEDPNVDMSVQERRIVNEEEEEAKKNHRKILGVFPVSRTASRPGSGTSTPNPASGNGKDQAHPQSSLSSSDAYEEGDELPPREADIGQLSHIANQSKESVASTTTEDEELRSIPKTAGFDFQAISRELGKEIDVDKLKLPESSSTAPPDSVLLRQEPPERTGSAPPIGYDQLSGSNPKPPLARRASHLPSLTPDDDEESMGDIGASSSGANLDVPSWDRPPAIRLSQATEVSPPATSTFKAPSFGYDAWSSAPTPAPSSTATSTIPSLIMRSAPPARPHPAELLANPFGSDTSPAPPVRMPTPTEEKGGWGTGILGGWGNKKNEERDQWADKNPW